MIFHHFFYCYNYLCRTKIQKTMARKSESKDNKFLKVPEYPGGKQALQSFINENLRYPADALEQKLEGVVNVEYEVDDRGFIVSSKVIKGLSPSCNEEALRVVGLLRYSQAYNHGIRVTSKKKVNIYFKLLSRKLENTLQINFSITNTNSQQNNSSNDSSEGTPNYSYTIYG